MRTDDESHGDREIGPEVPEADALEQSKSVPPEDETGR